MELSRGQLHEYATIHAVPDLGCIGFSDAFLSPSPCAARHSKTAQQKHRAWFGNRGDAERKIIDSQSMIVAGIVSFDPAKPQRIAGGPIQSGDGPSQALDAAGGISIYCCGCGPGYWSGEVEVLARSGPA